MATGDAYGNFGDAIHRYFKYFKLGRDLNQRDTIAVKPAVAVQQCLEHALEGRRRVKEQLEKIERPGEHPPGRRAAELRAGKANTSAFPTIRQADGVGSPLV